MRIKDRSSALPLPMKGSIELDLIRAFSPLIPAGSLSQSDQTTVGSSLEQIAEVTERSIRNRTSKVFHHENGHIEGTPNE
jgi:hypothetical protein